MNQEYNSFLKGKSVALVGGHDDINWNKVSFCDVVVRVNSHQKRQGGRCEVIYFSCADDLDIGVFDGQAIQHQLQWAWLNKSHLLFGANQGQYNLARSKIKPEVKIGEFYQAPAAAFEVFRALRDLPAEDKWPYEFAARYSFHPMTGILALHHLQQSDAASIYVDGMTVFQSGDEFVQKAGTHHMAPQIAFLLDARIDTRVEYSEKLNLLVDKYASIATDFLAIVKN